MALEVVVLDKDEYKALIDNQADEDELEYLKACQYALESFGGTDTCSALFSNKEVDIGDYSDWEMIDGKHYCPDCYEVEVIDGVYNVKAKEK